MGRNTQPPVGADTFHGRDWFAPVAVRLVRSEPVALDQVEADSCVGYDWPDRLEEVTYIDTFGNLITGVPVDALGRAQVLRLGGRALRHAHTFAEVPEGQAFWHENSLGLLELSVNQGSAAEVLGLTVGDPLPFSI